MLALRTAAAIFALFGVIWGVWVVLWALDAGWHWAKLIPGAMALSMIVQANALFRSQRHARWTSFVLAVMIGGGSTYLLFVMFWPFLPLHAWSGDPYIVMMFTALLAMAIGFVAAAVLLASSSARRIP